MNTPKYPRLRQHQKLISETGFLNPLPESLEPRTAILAKGQSQWRNVCEVNKRSKTPKLMVRLFLNQRRITFAQCAQGNWKSALRIADMAVLKFWKYRVRGAPVPDSTQFNFSLAQATLDLEKEAVHAGLLNDYEEILIQHQELPNAEQLTTKRAAWTAPRVSTSLRKQVDGWADVICGLVKGQVEDLKQLEEIKLRIGNIENAFKQVVVLLGAINAKLK